MIKPTVGRVVLFNLGPNKPEGFNAYDSSQPFAATVAYVWSDRMVNLSVVDHAGKQHAITSVQLLQDADQPSGGWYCEWMPYQKGQAARTEVAEKIASERASGDLAGGLG